MFLLFVLFSMSFFDWLCFFWTMELRSFFSCHSCDDFEVFSSVLATAQRTFPPDVWQRAKELVGSCCCKASADPNEVDKTEYTGVHRGTPGRIETRW